MYQAEVIAIKERIDTAHANMWLSLNERFRKYLELDDVGGLGIRTGGVAVTMPASEPAPPGIEVKVIRLDNLAEPDEEPLEVGLVERIRKLFLN